MNQLEMLSGRGKKEYAKQAQEADDDAAPTHTNGATEEPLEAVVAM